jgi:hypothetical protein
LAAKEAISVWHIGSQVHDLIARNRRFASADSLEAIMVADTFNVPFQGSFAVEDQDVAGSRLTGQLIRVKQPPTGHRS